MDGEVVESKTELFNKLFEFRKQKDMMDDCILDVIIEFGNHIDMDPELIASELSDYTIFRDIVEKDLKKFKFARYDLNQSDIDIWE